MTNQYSYADEFAARMPEVSHKRNDTQNLSSAARVYMMSRMQKENVASNYRSGNDNGQKYMTSDDFVTYFRNRQANGALGVNREQNAPANNVAKRPMSSASESTTPIPALQGSQMPCFYFFVCLYCCSFSAAGLWVGVGVSVRWK